MYVITMLCNHRLACQLTRLPDILVSGLICFTGILLFLFRPLVSELAERNSTISGHMVGSKCDLKMHVRNLGYALSVQIEGLKHYFVPSQSIAHPLSGINVAPHSDSK